MSPRKTQIVLNGKTYDIAGGKSINNHPASNVHHAPSSPAKTTAKHHGPKSIDGVVGKSRINHRVQKTSNKDFSHHVNYKNPLHSSTGRNVHPTNHHKVQKSKILMRSSVSAPSLESDAVIIAPEDSLVLPDQKARLARAKKVSKSPVITRFPANYQTAENFTRPSPKVVEAPVVEHANASTHHAKHNVPNHTKAKTRQETVFEQAMVSANSHHATSPKTHHKRHVRVKRRNLKYATGILSALLLTGFVLYQNVPNFSMRIASNKAGFNASLPAYSPSGYSMSGPVVYSPGKVTVNFSSNTDERNYTISQQVSNWNSQALVDNYLANVENDYQSYQEKGKTIYIYDNGNATWVSGGVWYNLQGGTELNTDQLLKIAASL